MAEVPILDPSKALPVLEPSKAKAVSPAEAWYERNIAHPLTNRMTIGIGRMRGLEGGLETMGPLGRRLARHVPTAGEIATNVVPQDLTSAGIDAATLALGSPELRGALGPLASTLPRRVLAAAAAGGVARKYGEGKSATSGVVQGAGAQLLGETGTRTAERMAEGAPADREVASIGKRLGEIFPWLQGIKTRADFDRVFRGKEGMTRAVDMFEKTKREIARRTRGQQFLTPAIQALITKFQHYGVDILRGRAPGIQTVDDIISKSQNRAFLNSLARSGPVRDTLDAQEFERLSRQALGELQEALGPLGSIYRRARRNVHETRVLRDLFSRPKAYLGEKGLNLPFIRGIARERRAFGGMREEIERLGDRGARLMGALFGDLPTSTVEKSGAARKALQAVYAHIPGVRGLGMRIHPFGNVPGAYPAKLAEGWNSGPASAVIANFLNRYMKQQGYLNEEATPSASPTR